MAATHADVLVIGAGVIGLACALRLAQEDKRVLLIDRNLPGTGASCGNAGHVATEQIFPLASPEIVRGALGYLFDDESPLRIRREYLLAILPWLLRFAWASRRSTFDRGVTALSSLQQTARTDLAALLEQAKAANLLKWHGHLILVENIASVAAAQMEIARLNAFGINVDWISPAEFNEIAPGVTADIEGAMRFGGTGHVDDPYAVCLALRDAFISLGGQLVRDDVLRVERASNGHFAHTSSAQVYEATNLVLSCGAWSKTLAAQLGYTVPLDTERGYHITLPGVSPQFAIPVASFERKVIMTPMSCGLRMTGTVEFGGLHLPPDPKRFAQLHRHMRALAGDLPVNEAICWMGFRPSLPDHLPVLGRAPDDRNVFFAFGHQHLGLTLAGVTARIIAAQVMNRKLEIDLAPFAPDRF